MRPLLLLAPLALAAALPVQAQQQCGPRADVVSTLGQKYDEQLIGGGLQGAERILEVWRAEDGSSWTILLTEAGGKSCIIAAGREILAFGTLLNIRVVPAGFQNWVIMAMAPGAFFLFAIYYWLFRIGAKLRPETKA